MPSNNPDNRRKVTIAIDDDQVQVHPGINAVADLKDEAHPAVPPDHRLWLDDDDGEDIPSSLTAPRRDAEQEAQPVMSTRTGRDVYRRGAS